MSHCFKPSRQNLFPLAALGSSSRNSIQRGYLNDASRCLLNCINSCVISGLVSGIIALDIDPRNHGTEILKTLEAKFGPLSRARWRNQGREGGLERRSRSG